MDIMLEKELADLKEQHQKLIKELNRKIDLKTDQYISKAFNDFKSFFSKHDFSISEGKQRITATYKSAEYVLKYDIPKAPYWGYYHVFDFIVRGQSQPATYNIVLRSKGSGPRSTAHVVPPTPGAMLKLKIDKEKHDIDYTQKCLDNFDQEIWGYELKPDNPRIRLTNRIKYDSIYELLEAMTTNQQ